MMFISDDMKVILVNCFVEFHPDPIYCNLCLKLKGGSSLYSYPFYPIYVRTSVATTFQQYCTFLPKAMAEAIMGFTPFKSHTLSSCLQTNKFQVNQSSILVKWSFDISISSHASNSKMKKKYEGVSFFCSQSNIQTLVLSTDRGR